MDGGVVRLQCMEVKPLQPEKADLPMDVTELGMVMEVRPLQPEKAPSPMDVTELGITVLLHPFISVLLLVLIRALQLSREPYTVLSLSTTIEVRPLQYSKA